MITTTLSFAFHLNMSSYQGVRVVGRLLGYAIPESISALPHSTLAATKVNIDFNTKHLKTGDALPLFNGKPRVYNMRFCPYAQRTILALNAKGIDYEVVNIDLIDKPEWLYAKSAFGKVPSLELKEGEVVYESLVTVEYLDEVYPQRPLISKDPLKKAFDKIIIESTGPIHSLFVKIFKAPDSITEENIANFFKALDFIQSQLQSRGTKFLGKTDPGFADYMIWPWFERITNLDLDDKFTIKPDKYGLLLEYFQNMLKDPAVSQYLVPKEILIKIRDAYAKGQKPDYDILRQ